MLADVLLYLLVGAGAGFMGGLLGIGGGVLIVAALSFTLPGLGIPSTEVMQVAIATSLTGIVLTASSSTFAQVRRRALLWPTLF